MSQSQCLAHNKHSLNTASIGKKRLWRDVHGGKGLRSVEETNPNFNPLGAGKICLNVYIYSICKFIYLIFYINKINFINKWILCLIFYITYYTSSCWQYLACSSVQRNYFCWWYWPVWCLPPLLVKRIRGTESKEVDFSQQERNVCSIYRSTSKVLYILRQIRNCSVHRLKVFHNFETLNWLKFKSCVFGMKETFT